MVWEYIFQVLGFSSFLLRFPFIDLLLVCYLLQIYIHFSTYGTTIFLQMELSKVFKDYSLFRLIVIRLLIVEWVLLEEILDSEYSSIIKESSEYFLGLLSF